MDLDRLGGSVRNPNLRMLPDRERAGQKRRSGRESSLARLRTKDATPPELTGPCRGVSGGGPQATPTESVFCRSPCSRASYLMVFDALCGFVFTRVPSRRSGPKRRLWLLGFAAHLAENLPCALVCAGGNFGVLDRMLHAHGRAAIGANGNRILHHVGLGVLVTLVVMTDTSVGNWILPPWYGEHCINYPYP